MSRGWFGGLVLLGLGVILLLGNFGQLDINFEEFWKLWPLFLILPGLSLLFRSRTGSVLGLLFLIAAGVFVWGWFAHPDFVDRYFRVSWLRTSTQLETTTFSERYVADNTIAKLQLETGAGKINLSSTRGSDKLLSGEGKSNWGKYQISRSQSGGVDTLKIDQAAWRHFFMMGNHSSDLNLVLDTRPDWEFDLKVGAADLVAELDNLAVTNFRLEAGATTARIKLGDMASKLIATVKVGAAHIRIEVPKSVGVELRESSGLSTNNFPGFTKQSDGVYFSDGKDMASKTITLTLESGASTIDVVRY